jgi:hypothetical protein
VWANSDAIITGATCTVKADPPTGVFARYTNQYEASPLTINTPSGSNYFVKLEDATTHLPIMSFFIHGGGSVDAQVPAGIFTMKVASGQAWCGETNLFGSDTSIDATARTLSFYEGNGHSVTVSRVPRGNLPIRRISRGDF